MYSERKTNHRQYREDHKMYEIVKTVNGLNITRMRGTRGAYHVNIREDDGRGFKEFHTFKTIKAAVAFCEAITA